MRKGFCGSSDKHQTPAAEEGVSFLSIFDTEVKVDGSLHVACQLHIRRLESTFTSLHRVQFCFSCQHTISPSIHICRVLGKSDPFCYFEQRLPFTCKIPARCGLFPSHLTTPSSSFAVIAQLQNLYTSLFLSISFPSSSPHHRFPRADREFTGFSSVALPFCMSSHTAHFQHLRHLYLLLRRVDPLASDSRISSQSSNHLQPDQPSLLHKRLSTSPHQQWPLSLTPKLATWLLPGFASMLNPR